MGHERRHFLRNTLSLSICYALGIVPIVTQADLYVKEKGKLLHKSVSSEKGKLKFFLNGREVTDLDNLDKEDFILDFKQQKLLDRIRDNTLNQKLSDGSVYTSYKDVKDFENHFNGDFTIESWF